MITDLDSLNDEKVEGIFIASSMVDSVLTEAELLEIINGSDLYSELMSYLASKNQSARQVIYWLEDWGPDLELIDALTSVTEGQMPTTGERAEAIRALLFTLVCPALSLSRHLQYLRDEGMSSRSIVLSARLIGAYFGELSTRLA